MSSTQKQTKLKRQLYQRALLDSVTKLDPRQQIRNPVMFIVEVGSVLLTLLFGWTLLNGPLESDSAAFIGAVAAWLWFTVLFANFAEALAEGRGKAQAQALRQTQQETTAKKLAVADPHTPYQITTSTALRQGDVVLVEAGE